MINNESQWPIQCWLSRWTTKVREPFKQFCRFHPQGQKMVLLHQMGLKMAKKELIVDLKGLAVQFLDQNIPDFWFKKKYGNFFCKIKGAEFVCTTPPLSQKNSAKYYLKVSVFYTNYWENFVAQLLQAPTMSPHILTFAFLFSKVEQKDEAEGVCTRKSIKVK